MIERKSYYIYIIKFYFAFFALFCFIDHVTTLTTPLTKSLCFLWRHHGGRGHWIVGVFPCKCLCYTKNVPFWRQHSMVDSGRRAYGQLRSLCLFEDGGRREKRQNVYKVYTKTTAFFGKLQFLRLCIQKCRTLKFAYSGI